MAKQLILVLFSGFILLNAQNRTCSCSDFKKKKYHFKLLRKKGVSVDSSKIRFDGIYLYCVDTVNVHGKLMYFRFFENGKFFSSCIYDSLPNIIELNKLDSGTFGEYYMYDSLIITEQWGCYINYYINSGILKNGKIQKWQRIKRKYNSKYWRLKSDEGTVGTVEFVFYPVILTSKPDW